MKKFKLALEKFNEENGEVTYFPILRDDHIYLYCTYENQSILCGRFTYAGINEWSFYEYDYDTDNYTISLTAQREQTLENVLKEVYEKVIRNMKRKQEAY